MSNKSFKIYETKLCECGHVCPVSYAVIDEDGYYTCPDCYIKELESLFIDEAEEYLKHENRLN